MNESRSDAVPASGNDSRSVDAERRRLLGRGVAAPAVLTVVSTPVMGATCFTASAQGSLLHASGLARHTANSSFPCNGQSPDQWLAVQTNTWPSAYPASKKFSEVFNPLPSGVGANDSLRKVLEMTGLPAARAFIATLLNISSGRVDPRLLAGATVPSLWATMHTAAGFVPYAGAKAWTPAKVTAWLAASWGAPLPADFSSSL